MSINLLNTNNSRNLRSQTYNITYFGTPLDLNINGFSITSYISNDHRRRIGGYDTTTATVVQAAIGVSSYGHVVPTGAAYYTNSPLISCEVVLPLSWDFVASRSVGAYAPFVGAVYSYLLFNEDSNTVQATLSGTWATDNLRLYMYDVYNGVGVNSSATRCVVTFTYTEYYKPNQ